jgi:hypothetical protein
MDTLFVVTGDPRRSPRPAEAIRIAAGVSAWKKVAVSMYLRGPAVWVLSEFVDEMVDADSYVNYLPVLAETGRPVLVEAGVPDLAALGQPTMEFCAISEKEFAALAGASRYVVRF